jgi:predicted MFS family arabinose efflux permease
MYGGLLLSACGVLSLAWPAGFWLVALGRALAGVGQGMLFIGVQNYILAVASPERRTQGAAIIVFGFQGGMIAGTAIGSLLVTYMGAAPVFLLAGVLGLASALYTLLLVPPIGERAPTERDDLRRTVAGMIRDIRKVGASSGFLKTFLMIGVPAKAVLTGVVVFALPLILAQRQYPQDDIGQIIMIYGIGVLVASSYTSRRVDRTGRSGSALAWGAGASGLGLVMIGFAPVTPAGALLLITGVAVVGLAHGCINAPVVTHVADLEVSRRIGIDSATTTYRFLERIGHALGPVLIAQLLTVDGKGAVAWVGGAVALLGLLFALRVDPGPHRMERSASA